MKQRPGNALIWYSSLFITLMMSTPRLLIMQRNGLLGRLLPFNPYAWVLQTGVCFLFCLSIFYYNRKYFHLSNRQRWLYYAGMLMTNLLLLAIFTTAGGFISHLFFQSRLFPLNGYLLRLSIALVLIFVECRVLTALYYAQQKEQENDKLRLAKTSMELELLKTQLNPHFFFNALSSLSGVVREDPERAQTYISHLSKIFRYSIRRPPQNLVSLREEIDEAIAFSELMKMRHEQGFNLVLEIDDDYHSVLLPYMSLQPLLENALKHNIATPHHPLTVSISMSAGKLQVRNNLQPKLSSPAGMGIGLANLNDRFRILVQQEIEISSTAGFFTVKLPFQ